jgi:ubiquitin carboxyl-terminal hydrolase 14
MRKIKFPMKLDMYNMCSERLQKILKVPRDAHRDALMAEMEAKSKEAREANAVEEAAAKRRRQEAYRGAAGASAGSDAMDTDPSAAAKPPTPPGAGAGKGDGMDVDDEDAAALQAALAMSMETGEQAGETAGVGLPASFQGYYEPFALVTHKGRSADGGHYIGWTRTKEKFDFGPGGKKQKKGQEQDKWICFDDADVEPVPTEHIEKLCGGGDLDMAYLIFYRYKDGC